MLLNAGTGTDAALTTISRFLGGIALLMALATLAHAQSAAPAASAQPGSQQGQPAGQQLVTAPLLIPKPLHDVLAKTLPPNVIPGFLPGSMLPSAAQNANAATNTNANIPQPRRTVAQPRDTLLPVPLLQGHVNDLAGLLQPDQREALEAQLSDYEARTGSQVVVLTVDSTDPENINDFGIRVTDAWKLGRKGIDDGVLLIVAKNNSPGSRRLAILTGVGVQGVLTDVMSHRILQDVIAPRFQRGDFYGGLTAGVTAITTILDQQTLPPAQRAQAGAGDGSGSGSAFAALAPLLLFGFFTLMSIATSRRNGTASGRGMLTHNLWGNAAGVVLGTLLSGGGGGFGGGGGGGGFSGGGGNFDGGGASGDW